MNKITVDNIEITQEQIKFIGRLSDDICGVSRLDTYISDLNKIKDTFIRVMCDAQNPNNQTLILESLSCLLVVQDEFISLSENK